MSLDLQIRIGGTAVGIERVYFAFGSGRLGYDCEVCGAKCCKGFGYQIADSHEYSAQVSERPAMALFIELDGSPTSFSRSVVKNCPPGCFFLSETGLCEVHATAGALAKPETCRLFPFNNFTLIGRHLIVAPHTGLCPLEVLDDQHLSGLSDHNTLLRSMAVRAIVAQPKQVLLDEGVAVEIIERERRILKICDLERATTCEESSRACLQVLGSSSDKESVDVASGRDAEASIDRFNFQLRKILDMWPAEHVASDQGLVKVISGSTPSLRARLLFEGAAVTPTEWTDRGQQAVWAILALHKIAALAIEGGMQRVTLQTLNRLLDDYREFLSICWLFNEVVIWKRDARLDLSSNGSRQAYGRYLDVVRGLTSSAQQKRPMRLYELLSRYVNDTRWGRLATLQRLAKRLVGRVEILTAGRIGKNRWTGRSAAQRVCLAAVSDEMLWKMAVRRQLTTGER